MPRKAKRAAIRSALLAKCLDGGVMLVDAIPCPEIKTRHMEALLSRLDLSETVLLVTDSFNEVIWKSARNLRDVRVSDARGISVFDILVPKRVLMEKQTFLKLLSPESPAPEAETAAEPASEQGQAEATAAGGNVESEPAPEQGEAGPPSEEGETEHSE